MERPCVLIVDDEVGVIRTLRASLEASGFETLVAMDGCEALEAIKEHSPDILILDILMPRMDGFEVCRRVREWSKIPIIMLSALHDEEEKVKCLDLGSDDYVCKPFDLSELIARVRAVLRRATEANIVRSNPLFTSGGLTVDFVKRRVTVNGNEIRLTLTEYSFLRELVLNAGTVLTHKYLLNKVWGPRYVCEIEYLRVFANRLRAKIEPDPARPKHIVTVRGVGYKFQTTT